MYDIYKLWNPLYLGVTRHWRCCLSYPLIPLKRATQLGTHNLKKNKFKYYFWYIFWYTNLEVIFINNNESYIIKGRVDATLFDVLKQLLNKKQMTQQDLIEGFVKEFVLQNLSLIISKDDKVI